MTISPNEIQSHLVIRLCDHHTNQTLAEIVLMTSEQRALLTSKNPVAAAIFFEEIIDATLEHLLGVKNAKKKKSTMECTEDIMKGVLGNLFAFYGAIECQGRGIYHNVISFIYFPCHTLTI